LEVSVSRRKVGRRAGSRDSFAFLVLGLLIVAGVVVQFIQDHPVITTLIIVMILAMAVAVAYRRITLARRLAAYERAVAITDGMSGPEFEQFIARLMRASGCRRVTVCGGAGDEGADVIGYAPDGRRLVVQCKRYKNSVGSPEVQRFAGTAHRIHGADIALLVTNGRLTRQAWDVARRCDIIAFDRDRLAAWLSTNVPSIPGWPTGAIKAPAQGTTQSVANRLNGSPGGPAAIPLPPTVRAQPPLRNPGPVGPVSTAIGSSDSDWWSDPDPN
jgi:restriction system protein